MKLYIVKKKTKNGDGFYKLAVVKSTNDLNGEEVFFSGFYEELDEARKWGEDGFLLGVADITRDRERNRKK